MKAQTPQLKLVVIGGGTAGQEFAIADRPQTIGRAPTNDIVLSDPLLSRQHARIKAVSQGYVIEDLGAANGVFINETRISGAAPLRSGDILRLGNLSFRVMITPAVPGYDATVITPAVHPQPPLASPKAGPDQTTVWLWLGLGLAALLLLVVTAGAGYWYYSRPAAPAAAELPTATAVPPPTAPPTLTPTSPPTATVTQTPESTTTPLPLPTATPAAINVPGLAAATARELRLPVGIANNIDPFCNKELQVVAGEPVYLSWQRRLAPTSSQTDYVAQWLASAYYDLTLAGRPVAGFNYYRGDGPTLVWWADLGVLPPGRHYVRIIQYTSRPLSNGLDIEPADGQLDSFGPGRAGEGFCELVVPEPTPTATLTLTATPVPTVTPVPPSPTTLPPPTPVLPAAAPSPTPLQAMYVLRLGGQHRYEEPWGAPRHGDPCQAWRDNDWDDRNANFRGFNVELLLTNNSAFKVADDWEENVRFFTNRGQEVGACYYGYTGSGPAPQSTISVTFFSVVPRGDFVQVIELNLNGQYIRLCLDGGGGWSGC